MSSELNENIKLLQQTFRTEKLASVIFPYSEVPLGQNFFTAKVPYEKFPWRNFQGWNFQR